MGTRGTTGFIINGERKSSYQQYGSYLDGVGLNVLNFARDLVNPLLMEQAREQAARLVIVDESEAPTPEQAEALAEFTNSGVSTGSDWYATLRNTQGKPAEILRSGYITGGDSFLHEEFDYIINFDEETLSVYAGGHKLASLSLSALPSDTDFVALYDPEADY